MPTNTLSRTLPSAAIGKTLLVLAAGFVTLLIAASPALAEAGSQQVAAAFEPSWFVQGITGLFALATLATGALALANIGLPLLVDTATFVRVDNDEQVRAPNVRGWGVRQIATGVTLWAALLLGDQVLFQVGLASVVIRQGLDIVANLLDRRPLAAAPYVATAVPTIAALLQVL